MLFTNEPLICAISGKVITEIDNVIGIPPFTCTPHEPEFICNEAHVLREEFDKWGYRQSVIRRLKEDAISSFSQENRRNFFQVIIQDDRFLLIRSRIENWYRLYFHDYFFVLQRIDGDIWPTFCKGIISEYGEIIITSTTKLSWGVGENGILLTSELHYPRWRIFRDCIEMPKEEWNNFGQTLRNNMCG